MPRVAFLFLGISNKIFVNYITFYKFQYGYLDHHPTDTICFHNTFLMIADQKSAEMSSL